jgi:hypothetical protein
MNRPKKQFIPTTLSDLNIDALSIGSNGDRSNNNYNVNSNGARLTNFDRFKATSSSNISYKHSNFNSASNNSNNNNLSRTSKLYGSQSNISTASGTRYQSVNNNYTTPPTSASGDTDKWLEAWEDNNNNYRAPSFHPKQQSNSFSSNSRPRFETMRSNSINQKNSKTFNSNDPFDPFDDPWSGTLFFYYFCTHNRTPLFTIYSFFYYYYFTLHVCHQW